MSGDEKPPEGAGPGSDAGNDRPRVIGSIAPRPVIPGITPRRIAPVAPAGAPTATVTRLRIDAPERVDRPVRVFETIRIVDLPRFRQSLRRHRALLEKKGGELAVTSPLRARLLAILDQRYAGSSTAWPDVVVIRRPETGIIETNYAIVGGTIYLGAHLSDDWTEGRENDRFYETLAEALIEQGRAAGSQFEPLRHRPDTERERND